MIDHSGTSFAAGLAAAAVVEARLSSIVARCTFGLQIDGALGFPGVCTELSRKFVLIQANSVRKTG
ncbi:MAG: hypothetical protein IPJ90_22210 [Anaerolineaceae bacterium]|nr:hypothetical protein [Anaerolineaceae bacterium]